MGDLGGIPYFRRQAPAEARLGTFDGDSLIQPFVFGFVDDAHSAPRHFAKDPKAALQQFSGLEGMLRVRAIVDRVQQEPIHSLLPLHVVPHHIE
jgi:hypothetical protein